MPSTGALYVLGGMEQGLARGASKAGKCKSNEIAVVDMVVRLNKPAVAVSGFCQYLGFKCTYSSGS